VRRHEYFTGAEAGQTVEVDYWIVTLREGRIFRDEWFTDRGEAREAAGLRDG
jgi:ketosteroid isomerase-like protein